MSNLPDNSIDLIITSPPYDSIRDYNKNQWTLDLPGIGQQVGRILKEGGVCAVVIQDQTKNGSKSLTTARMQVNWCDNGTGLKLWECLIYQRSGSPGNWWSKRFRVDHEYIPIFIKNNSKGKTTKPNFFNKKPLYIECKNAGKKGSKIHKVRATDNSLIETEKWVNAPTKCRGTIWDYEKFRGRDNLDAATKLKRKHPATFPRQLAHDLIICFSEPGHIVLDPMCGSGTTCVMAKQLKRIYIGNDINDEYCQLAREWLKTV